MKWIILIVIVGVMRGILLPDYRWEPNIWLIPFATPVGLSALAVYLSTTKRLSKLLAFSTSLLSVYLSTVIGITVYGMSVGWEYVTEDIESQAVFGATIGVQTIVFIVASVLIGLFVNRVNKNRRHRP